MTDDELVQLNEGTVEDFDAGTAIRITAPEITDEINECPTPAHCDHCSWCHDEVAVAVLQDGDLHGYRIGPICIEASNAGLLVDAPSGRRLKV
jgi:hypothetical protein